MDMLSISSFGCGSSLGLSSSALIMRGVALYTIAQCRPVCAIFLRLLMHIVILQQALYTSALLR